MGEFGNSTGDSSRELRLSKQFSARGLPQSGGVQGDMEQDDDITLIAVSVADR
jgi:hypothetical protein